ncbi:MAG: hypothetical protein LBV00_02640 [Propionibacteriaceae bacterium]|jgi:hypothetical protein|nr:hypothetical protein [Propionibacteriaceae bacterium]
MRAKSLFSAIGLIIVAVGMAGCGAVATMDYPEYAVSDNSQLGYSTLIHNGVIYVPFGVVGADSLRGEQIGVREGVPDSTITAVKGYDSRDWIIEYLDVLMGGGDMLYRAIDVTEIPPDLEQHRQFDY